MDRNYDIINLIIKIFILRRPGIAIFADIIKVLAMFIITIYKDPRKVKINRNCIKIQSISVFLDIAKFANFL